MASDFGTGCTSNSGRTVEVMYEIQMRVHEITAAEMHDYFWC